MTDDDADERPAYGPRETSRDAFEVQQDGTAAVMRDTVLQFLKDAGENGLTDHELHDLFPASTPDGGPRNRRVDLYYTGEVVELLDAKGELVTRLSRSGATRITVWRALREGEVAVPKARPPKRKPTTDPQGVLVEAIIETLKDREGAGSDLYNVEGPEGPEPWLYVYGNIDIGHLANVVLDTVTGMKVKR